MKPKGWKKDPHWVTYEENRITRKRYEMAMRQKDAAECQQSLMEATKTGEHHWGPIHAVH